MTDQQWFENHVLTAVERFGWHWILTTLATECRRQVDESDGVGLDALQGLQSDLDKAAEAVAMLGDE